MNLGRLATALRPGKVTTAAVVTRLQRGQVDTVLLVDDPTSTVVLVGPGEVALAHGIGAVLRHRDGATAA